MREKQVLYEDGEIDRALFWTARYFNADFSSNLFYRAQRLNG